MIFFFLDTFGLTLPRAGGEVDVGDPIYLPHKLQLSQQAMGQVTILTNSQQVIPLGNVLNVPQNQNPIKTGATCTICAFPENAAKSNTL